MIRTSLSRLLLPSTACSWPEEEDTKLKVLSPLLVWNGASIPTTYTNLTRVYYLDSNVVNPTHGTCE
ncbi:26351_t:CDS:2 [Dentiscutata erythropus]|uniref:26351_t:CDS:1 n=1 Tax=Dentiscutata erythropus TaxID=1348616 RepID=A0A9N9H0G2_9GLOM|nr:26351_t:CDS:2 [Dentiscutata erythropus]